MVLIEINFNRKNTFCNNLFLFSRNGKVYIVVGVVVICGQHDQRLYWFTIFFTQKTERVDLKFVTSSNRRQKNRKSFTT